MDITSIIICIVLFFIGLVLGWGLWGRKSTSEANEDVNVSESSASVVDESLLTEKEDQLRKSQAELDDLRAKTDDLKSQISVLQKEKDKEIGELQVQLQNATEGKLDEVVKQKLDSVEKLKKQISDLEDDVDDLEDDVEDYKKKLKSKDAELSQVQEEYDNISREAKKLKENLAHTKDDLARKAEDLDMKVKSIAFVQEILLAKGANGKDEKMLGQRVDDLKDYVRTDFKETISKIWKIEKDKNKLKDDPVFGMNLDSWAATAKKSWLRKKTTIALVGEFSAGKTSIVNRILSMDDPSVPLLPVSTKATTAIPTYISGADSPSYRFVTPGDEIKSMSESAFKKVDKEVLGQIKGVSSLIKYFVMKYKNPNLSQLSILDTPGFNSNDPEDAERTIDVINECDALFWVFDVNAGTVNRSSIDLIKKNLTRPLYVVINKTDTKSKVEVDQVETLIKKTLKSADIDVQMFIRFSAKADINAIMEPIQQVKHSSVKDDYLDNLLNTADYFLAEQLKDVKKAEKEATKLENNYDQLANDYYSSLRKLQDDCEEACGIPHWEEHLFSKDRYEMDADEGESLLNLLKEINEQHSKDLANGFDKQCETVKELVDAWSISNLEKANHTELLNRVEMLRKKIKAIEKAL